MFKTLQRYFSKATGKSDIDIAFDEKIKSIKPHYRETYHSSEIDKELLSDEDKQLIIDMDIDYFPSMSYARRDYIDDFFEKNYDSFSLSNIHEYDVVYSLFKPVGNVYYFSMWHANSFALCSKGQLLSSPSPYDVVRELWKDDRPSLKWIARVYADMQLHKRLMLTNTDISGPYIKSTPYNGNEPTYYFKGSEISEDEYIKGKAVWLLKTG